MKQTKEYALNKLLSYLFNTGCLQKNGPLLAKLYVLLDRFPYQILKCLEKNSKASLNLEVTMTIRISKIVGKNF